MNIAKHVKIVQERDAGGNLDSILAAIYSYWPLFEEPSLAQLPIWMYGVICIH